MVEYLKDEIIFQSNWFSNVAHKHFLKFTKKQKFKIFTSTSEIN